MTTPNVTHISVNLTDEHLGTEADAAVVSSVIELLHAGLQREFPKAQVNVNARAGKFLSAWPEEDGVHDLVSEAIDRLVDEALEHDGVVTEELRL